MKQFDELSIAEEMNEKKCFLNGYSRTDLFLYAKWLKYKSATTDGIDYDTITSDQLKKYDEVVEKQLVDFCHSACGNWNYSTKYQDIDFALDNSNRFKLRLPLPLPITQSELDSILSVDNENYRRMLFIMLVDAKYFRYHSISVDDKTPITEDTVFYCKMTRGEIKKTAKIKYASESEKKFFLNCIYSKGLFDISESKLRSWYIKFVDTSDSNIIDYITDYDHLTLHYEKLVGEKIGKCEKCGCLFRNSKYKNAKYCYKHRGKEKMITNTLTCCDCGNEFVVGSKSRRKIRCDSCQKAYMKAYKKEYYSNHK